MYVIARNAHGRPTVIHSTGADLDTPGCGMDMRTWSRVYFRKGETVQEIVELLLCKRRGCRV